MTQRRESSEGLLVSNVGFVGDLRKAIGTGEKAIPYDTPVFVRTESGELVKLAAILYSDDGYVILELGSL